MQDSVHLKVGILNDLLDALANNYTVPIGRYIKAKHPGMASAERYVFPRYGNMLEYEGLATYIADNKHPLLQMKITPKGQKVIEAGGYIKWKEELAAVELEKEKDAELDRQDKLGSIADRKLNRILAYLALVISVISLVWTIVNESR